MNTIYHTHTRHHTQNKETVGPKISQKKEYLFPFDVCNKHLHIRSNDSSSPTVFSANGPIYSTTIFSSCHLLYSPAIRYNRLFSNAHKLSFSTAASLPLAKAAKTMAEAPVTIAMNNNKEDDNDDTYMWLEQVESSEALKFAEETNAKCLAALGNPTTSGTATYQSILKILESRDRIPHVSKYGTTVDKDDVLYNFWCDGQNPKGIWRKTHLSSYENTSNETKWATVLDVDELGREENVSWVWKGARHLPRARDPLSKDGTLVTRALLFLSRGGADATTVREFDMMEAKFVENDGFYIPKEAKTRASYKSRDVLFVGSDFGPDSLTDSGYPRTVKEWVRGTDLEDAPTVFEGEKTDVSISTWIDDQRHRGGSPIYEVRSRALTFYTARYWVRKVAFEHLLAPKDPQRYSSRSTPDDFVEVDVQRDAEIDFFANLLIVSLRSDWTVGGKTYIKGSLLCVDFEEFNSKGKDASDFLILFEPSERTALDTYSATKNFIILSIMDNVQSKLVFLYYNPTIQNFVYIGGDAEARIRAANVGGYDSYESDKFWFTTSGFLQPSTLYMADAKKVQQLTNTGAVQCDTQLDQYIEQQLKSLPPQFDAIDFDTVQRVAVSKDGSEVPYFLIYKKGTKMDGNTPTLLYGYGGFEVSLTPHYMGTAGAAWLERGGAYIEANIRGGGEFGPKWHQAALKENRCKAYEDFIAVAEHLQSSGLCKPKTLGIRGGSNGGLLMGNMLVMRPDLFGAIACAVPLLDMKRYHLLLAGASWMAEYGDPSTDDWKNFLHKYSPYHNIDPNANYPPILFTTSTRDDRVHPGHARKMVKKLTDIGEGRWPVYYYENIEGGHGGAADAKQQAFMTALAYDFLWDTLSKGISNECST